MAFKKALIERAWTLSLGSTRADLEAILVPNMFLVGRVIHLLDSFLPLLPNIRLRVLGGFFSSHYANLLVGLVLEPVGSVKPKALPNALELNMQL